MVEIDPEHRGPYKGRPSNHTLFLLPPPMRAINTAAYAAVLMRRFSGSIIEKTATLTAKRKIDEEITASVLDVAMPTTKISIGTTMISPPMIAKANLFSVIRN